MSDLSVCRTESGYWAVFRKGAGRVSRAFFTQEEAAAALSGFATRGPMVRRCLCCGVAFDSSGIAERLCPAHRNGRVLKMAEDWSPRAGRV